MDIKAGKILAAYVAFLRGLSLVHQNSHWTCKGPDFYSNHKLLQKVYEGTLEHLDAAGEKATGLCGVECLGLEYQSQCISSMLKKYATISDDPVGCSLIAEEDFCKFSKEVYSKLKALDSLTLGLDDFIMSTCNDHERFIYLLKSATS